MAQNAAPAALLADGSPVRDIASDCGQESARLLYKWSTQRGIPVVLGSASLASIEDAEKFFSWKLSEEAIKARSWRRSSAYKCWQLCALHVLASFDSVRVV
jgi:diketogulonate reductase-like aldo/keto reductase